MIRNQIPLEERHRLVIVSPEARGWPFASIISHTFHCPLVLVRNKGKEKGTSVASVDYSTIYSKQNCIEVSTHAPITFLSRPIIIDDGIASGGSHDAVRRLLLSQFGANTIASIFAFRHCRSDSNPKTIYESDRQQNVYSVFQLCQ
jgi:adenine phosphoribosyltransferase